MKKSLCIILVMILVLSMRPVSFAVSGGQWKDYGNQWAYQFADGSWAYNWQKIDGSWYYFGSDGWMKTGWQKIDGAWYYFYGSGEMAANTTIDGCYLDANGVWQEKQEPAGADRWVDYGNNRWAYQFADGSWAYGQQTIDGVRYYFGSDGWMKTGWQQIDGKWHYFAPDGSMTANGWRQIDRLWYFFDGAGVMATGRTKINGTWYFFDGDGRMKTGWQQIGNQWYYFDGSGAMATGWRQMNGKWYYFDDNGAMVTGWRQIDGQRYFFDGSGALADNSSLLVGISMPTKSLERWKRDGTYLKEQFEAAGYKVELTYSDNDVVRQHNDIANMIHDGVDLLIVTAIDSSALSRILADAAAAGIPVIAHDRLVTDAKIACYVSFDNYSVGVIQAKYVIDKLDLENAGGRTYNMEFVAGDPSDVNARYFFNGAKDTLQKYLDAGTLVVPSGKTEFSQVATVNWSTDNACTNFRNTLASFYSDGTVLDVALCSNDSTALGVARAITSDYAGSNTPIVTGQDGEIANLKNIVDGTQAMTVFKNVSDEVGVTLVVAEEILAGNTLNAGTCAKFSADAVFDTKTYNNGLGIVPSFLLIPYCIDKNNLQLLVDTGLYAMGEDGYLTYAG